MNVEVSNKEYLWKVCIIQQEQHQQLLCQSFHLATVLYIEVEELIHSASCLRDDLCKMMLQDSSEDRDSLIRR